MLTPKTRELLKHHFTLISKTRTCPFYFDKSAQKLKVLTSPWDLFLWKLNLLVLAECSVFTTLRFVQYYRSYESLGRINFHIFWIMGWAGPTVVGLVLGYYRNEFVANFNRALKWDTDLQALLKPKRQAWDILELGLWIVGSVPYFHVFAFVLIESFAPGTAQFHSSLAKSLGLGWIAGILIMYEATVALVVWRTLFGIMCCVIPTNYPVMRWTEEAYKIRTGQCGRTNGATWSEFDSRNAFQINREAQILMQEFNSYSSGSYVPAGITAIMITVILLSYNTIKLFQNTPLTAYIFYPLTDAVVILLAICISTEGQKIYDISAAFVEEFKRCIEEGQRSPKEKEGILKGLASLQPYGVNVGPFYKMKKGLLKGGLEIVIDQLITLLLSFN